MRILHKMQDDAQFSQSELAIRDYLCKKREEALTESTDELARANFVSKATLTRFAKKLGFSGWNEFKLHFARELGTADHTKEPADPNFPYNETDDIRQISDRLLSLKIDTLTQCFASIEPVEIERALTLIERQKRIHVFAEGYSLLASDDFCFRMTRVGKLVTNQGDIGIRYIARTLTPEDLGIIISYTGRTESVVKASRTLAQNGVPMIAVTNEERNPVSDTATISIPLPCEESVYSKLGNYSSVDSIRAVLDLLYSGYVARNPVSVTKRIRAAKSYDPKLSSR
ncbi:MAG: MurR/RpiR family transcriptional regulator [Collinsella sp.]|nr:MurR/RpiR family transcriptional regulator [Collinsella sp.]